MRSSELKRKYETVVEREKVIMMSYYDTGWPLRFISELRSALRVLLNAAYIEELKQLERENAERFNPFASRTRT